MCEQINRRSTLFITVVLLGSFVSTGVLASVESTGAVGNDAGNENDPEKIVSYIRKQRATLEAPVPSEHENLVIVDGEWTFNPVVYGLLLMTKTGSSDINGQLSMHFERVCGAKGYSYDAYNANDRYRRGIKKLKAGEIYDAGDIYSKIDKRYNRNNVPFQYMKEIGFEDCDYVALEAEAIEWDRNFGTWFKPMELHVPCRDPLDLFMSMCDHQGIKFSCKQKFQEEVNECLIGGERFVMSQLTNDNINLKCFGAPSRHGDYLDHMAERLQRKSFSTEYIHRGPTLPRSKNGECVWKQNGKYHERLQDHLKNKTDFKYYFKFCDECMVSENNLLL
eukprot:CAMPEP_0194323734 /NCGR_PEP_ID=MMETSP0171-20130528/25927_1 /TAXON_ID=218684 /ORGANISM="Corethron pennatum, Strain L29A3" /LENGTH=334 /DNA_ID=CAMNT_0039082445 /DNA_START=124 /DNA_END=1128 /DNA_ORIENTATION=-